MGDLVEAVAALNGAPVGRRPCRPVVVPHGGPDLAALRGQVDARRALEVAAAGGHHVLFAGPPGAGKTLLVRCFPAASCRHSTTTRHSRWRLPGALPGSTGAPIPPRRTARRTTPPRSPACWAEGAESPSPARRPSPIGACCSWTSWGSFRCTCSTRYASRSRRAASSWPARAAPSDSHAGSSSSPPPTRAPAATTAIR